MTRPIIIGVGGAHSGAGKTTYAAHLLRRLPGWGAIKYTKTGLYTSVIDDRESLLTEDKDTRKMLDAGAERVLWVQAPSSELGDVLPGAVERLSDLRGIVAEGNSAIEFLKPDIILFIFGDDAGEIKDSAKGILTKADLVVSGGGIPSGIPGKARRFGKSDRDKEELLGYIVEMIDGKEKIRSKLQEGSADGKISCSRARKIAEDLGVAYREVGRTADELKIKITACELGCF